MGELVQYNNMYYQWVKGDNIGRIEIFESYIDENNLNFIVFKSGKRINESLLLEYLIEVPEYQAKIVEDLNIESKIVEDLNLESPRVVDSNKENNPIMQLLLNQKKKEIEKLEIHLEIKIPKRELIEILRSSYGDEIENDIYQYINNQLDQNYIKEIITENIQQFIKTYYVSK